MKRDGPREHLLLFRGRG